MGVARSRRCGVLSRVVLLLMAIGSLAGCAAPPPPEAAVVEEPAIVTGVDTLYFRDPLRHAMSFASGQEGGVFQDHMVKNRGMDIDFGHYVDGAFTVAIEGGRLGAIEDLGSTGDLQQRYGYSETIGRGQGFASIRLDGSRFVILQDYDTQETQPLQGVQHLLGVLDEYNVSAPVHLDHVYLMRLVDRHDTSFERIVKFKVIAHTPGEASPSAGTGCAVERLRRRAPSVRAPTLIDGAPRRSSLPGDGDPVLHRVRLPARPEPPRGCWSSLPRLRCAGLPAGHAERTPGGARRATRLPG